MIKKSFNEIMKKEEGNGEMIRQVWAGYSLIPSGSVNVLKEEIMHKARKNANKILKYVGIVGQ